MIPLYISDRDVWMLALGGLLGILIALFWIGATTLGRIAERDEDAALRLDEVRRWLAPKRRRP